MSEESKAPMDLDLRARNIFESVFKEAFLSSPGGLSLDACQLALNNLLDNNTPEDLKLELEEIFY